MVKKIQVITGSVREGRWGQLLSNWIADIGRKTLGSGYEVEIVDLRDWKLPADDDPTIPRMGKYQSEFTKRFSAKISEGNAFVIVSPEYNGGYPGSLKNALDHLYNEWTQKPVLLATYGGGGGASAEGQLRHILGYFRTKVVTPSVSFSIRSLMGQNQDKIDLSEYFKPEDTEAGFKELVKLLEE